MTGLDNIFDRLERNVDKAVEKTRTYLGETTDRDLAFYNSMSPADFSAVVERYGLPEALRYIEEMEKKRLRESRNASKRN